jgi:lactate dehydrogenase-like 2-hydroxyacid dehydrogenase
MEISYCSRHHLDEWESQGVSYRDIDELCEWSDILSLHLSPYGPAKIVTKERLALLKDGCVFINTSAGRLVDQEALWAELMTGRINAYIDVYETLPPRKTIGDLMGKNNVFTYRAGWFTQEAVTYKGDKLIENLRSFLERDFIT